MSTIFAQLVPTAKSAISAIRVSGDESLKVLKLITRKNNILARKAILTDFFDPKTNEIIDRGLVLWFPAPHSFTGEDVIEFHLHGSPAVVYTMLNILSDIEGLRFAQPGEFSKLAFLNGKMDLTEAEGLADLIDAETELQAKQALRQMQGGLKNLYESWRSQLIEIMAQVEAYVDFPDEDIPQNIVEMIENNIFALRNTISAHLQDNNKGEILKRGIRVSIIGSPNVGKSTLINFLAKRNAAIVSDIPGTTRDIIEINLNILGYPFVIADTAGIRETEDKIEIEGVNKALACAKESDLILLVLDATELIISHEIEPFINNKTIIIVNKGDLTSVGLEDIKKYNPIIISAKTGNGVDELLQKLVNFAKESLNIGNDPVITRTRYRLLLQEALNSLNSFDLAQPIEICAENLRIASVALGKITGKIGVEDVLDRLFANFCIGK